MIQLQSFELVEEIETSLEAIFVTYHCRFNGPCSLIIVFGLTRLEIANPTDRSLQPLLTLLEERLPHEEAMGHLITLRTLLDKMTNDPVSYLDAYLKERHKQELRAYGFQAKRGR